MITVSEQIIVAATGWECALDRRGWRSVASGLATVAFLSVCATGTSARVDTLSDRADCARAPTPRCVVGLSLIAADSIADPYTLSANITETPATLGISVGRRR